MTTALHLLLSLWFWVCVAGSAVMITASVLVFAAILLSWIGRGEADVNGDPERDAGSFNNEKEQQL